MGRKNKKDNKTGSDGSESQGPFYDHNCPPGVDDDDARPLGGIYIPPEDVSPRDDYIPLQEDSNKEDDGYKDLIQDFKSMEVDTPLFKKKKKN